LVIYKDGRNFCFKHTSVARPSAICGGHSGIETGFSPSTSVVITFKANKIHSCYKFNFIKTLLHVSGHEVPSSGSQL